MCIETRSSQRTSTTLGNGALPASPCSFSNRSAKPIFSGKQFLSPPAPPVRVSSVTSGISTEVLSAAQRHQPCASARQVPLARAIIRSSSPILLEPLQASLPLSRCFRAKHLLPGWSHGGGRRVVVPTRAAQITPQPSALSPSQTE